jgi:hypothetical protein
LVGAGTCKSIGREGVICGREVGSVELNIAEDEISEEVGFRRVRGAVSQMVEMAKVPQVEVVESREGSAVEVGS